jgi:hypothetical protein
MAAIANAGCSNRKAGVFETFVGPFLRRTRPSLLPMTISLVAWSSMSAGNLVKRRWRHESVWW